MPFAAFLRPSPNGAADSAPAAQGTTADRLIKKVFMFSDTYVRRTNQCPRPCEAAPVASRDRVL